MSLSQKPGFVHLRVHSAYSLLEGALPIGTLVGLATKQNMPALGISDTNNLFGALEFSEKLSGAGVQPIIGCTLPVKFSAESVGADAVGLEDNALVPDGEIALIARDVTGYENLMWLTSEGFLTQGENPYPLIHSEDLRSHAEGLIFLSGGHDGPINRAIAAEEPGVAEAYFLFFREIFGDRAYIELQRHDFPDEAVTEPKLLELAYKYDVPIVATNEAYFPARDDYEAHDALVCISEGRYVAEDDRRRLTHEHYFKTEQEMVALFSDLPEALENTIEIARRCSHRPLTHAPILPQFVATDSDDNEAVLEAEAEELARQAREGLKMRLEKHGLAPGVEEKEYWDRLEYELGIIRNMKFPGYFLIVSDFIKWTKDQDIPVGPGRGSGAGSVVAWVLTITDLDPLRFGLLFERFLNPERVSMPDFDIDFCQDRRDEVIKYVQQKYGRDRVAQIITFGKLQARAVLRDVGRVLQMPYGQVDRLCKLVPNNPANPMTLEEAILEEPQLREAAREEDIVKELLEIGKKLEGLYRHASTHAAGVVIGDRPLTELVPLYADPRSSLPVTQFNMKWVEPAGLVKFDFLGLKTLTVIQKATEFIHKRGIEFDISVVPLDDKKTYELLARADTIGVFQLESTGMRDSLRNLRPDRFEDIIAMVALYRPGPMDNIPTYIARKYGEEEIDFLHPKLETVLKETYGVIIYQEQVMQIAQILAGYSLGEADLLRRAMGKKIKEEMDKQRIRFVDGAVKDKVDKKQAEFIFELVNKFAGYGFNKSHAAAYALVAYQTAYLKANYPVEFMAAIMTLDQGNTDKISMFYQAIKDSGIKVLPPDINSSFAEFRPEDGAIRFSMAALKNIGTQAVQHICDVREESGPYKGLTDFANRIDPKMLNKRAMEMLSAAGAFDGLVEDRSVVHGNCDTILAEANRSSADRSVGQNDLFGGSGAPQEMALRPVKPWLPMEKLSQEFDAVGFYISGHPLDEYKAALARMEVEDWKTFRGKAIATGRATGQVAGIVSYRQERTSKSGNRFAFAGFSDASGSFEAVLFSETLTACRELLEAGTAVLVRIDCEMEGEQLRTRVLGVEDLNRKAQAIQKGLKIRLDKRAAFKEIAGEIKKGRGQIFMSLKLEDMEQEIEFKFPGRYDVSPQQASIIRTMRGVVEVQEI
ncbi:MAG: DNA polymerase III subunit alpha [Methyloligellaceae bacterium]